MRSRRSCAPQTGGLVERDPGAGRHPPALLHRWQTTCTAVFAKSAARKGEEEHIRNRNFWIVSASQPRSVYITLGNHSMPYLRRLNVLCKVNALGKTLTRFQWVLRRLFHTQLNTGGFHWRDYRCSAWRFVKRRKGGQGNQIDIAPGGPLGRLRVGSYPRCSVSSEGWIGYKL